MEMTFDHETWHDIRGAVPAREGDSPPDWHGLQARFGAARALHDALGPIAGRGDRYRPGGGSFAPDGARKLAALAQILTDVNRIVSDDSKPGTDKFMTAASAQTCGGRG